MHHIWRSPNIEISAFSQLLKIIAWRRYLLEHVSECLVDWFSDISARERGIGAHRHVKDARVASIEDQRSAQKEAGTKEKPAFSASTFLSARKIRCKITGAREEWHQCARACA